MESLFECPVCHEDFNLSDKQPKSLKICGHLICSSCLQGILNNNNRKPKCPLDNLELPDHKNLDDFPVCFLVKEVLEKNKELLEKKAKKERCSKHNKKLKFFCLNDKEKICNKCFSSHMEQGHRFMVLKELIGKTEESRQKIKQFVKDVTIFHHEIEKMIHEKCQKYTNDIHKKFSEFKSLINKREQELISETTHYFESQKVKIQTFFGEDSGLLKDLLEKEAKLSSIFKYESFLGDGKVFENIQTQIEEWKVKINSKEAHKKFWDKLEQNNQDFCSKFIMSQNEFLSKTLATGLKSNEYLIENVFMKPENQIVLDHSNNDLNGLKTNSLLNIELANNCLTITTANEYKEILIEVNKWNQANVVKLTLDKTLSKEDESLLDQIWQRSKMLTSLYLKIGSGTMPQSLPQILSGGMLAFSSVSIDIEQYDVAKYPEVLLLIEQVLFKADSLYSLTLNAAKANFSSQTLKNILKIGFLDGKKMKHFRLDFRETNVTDEDIQNIFVAMPDLEKFYLNMTGTKITDKALEICGKNTLSTTNKLKSIKILVGTNLSITDYGIDSVLRNFYYLTNLVLILDETGITDQTIELISKRMSNQFNNLKEFCLSLLETNVSDNSLSQFFRPMPKLENLQIGLNKTAITDKTINNFVKNTLISIANPPSVFALGVAETNCTDRSISELLKNLNCEKNLYLNFNCKGVTDTSLTPFIQEKLPGMKKIKSLTLEVCNTTASQEIKDQIDALIKKINKS